MVFIKEGITLGLPGPLIKARRLGVFNWSKMDLHVVHNRLNVTTYPISKTVFPNGLRRKTSPQAGKSGGLLICLWFQRAVLVETTPACYLLPHVSPPRAWHYLHCVWAVPFPCWLMLWPLEQCLVLAWQRETEEHIVWLRVHVSQLSEQPACF